MSTNRAADSSSSKIHRLQVWSARQPLGYERGSLLITSNQAFSEWDIIFGDNMITVAAIDRIVYHSDIYQIQGESYRKKQALKPKSNTGQVS